MIHLDTNIVIALLNGRDPFVRDHLARAIGAGRPVLISTIVLYELRYGAARSARPAQNDARIETFLAGPLGLAPFTADGAAQAGAIRAALERQGRPIGPYDLLIGGQALADGAALATANLGEFTRIEGLAVEDWTQAT